MGSRRAQRTVSPPTARPALEDAIPCAVRPNCKDRLVDHLPVARTRYYHPDQAGSWSLKAVLPTIVPDLDYTRLDGVQDGGMAMAAYQKAIAGATTTPRRKAIRHQLLTYCQLDTEALLRLWSVFRGTGTAWLGLAGRRPGCARRRG